MIPLKDSIPSKSFPFINLLLILINLILFIYELSLDETQLTVLFQEYGLIPAKATNNILRNFREVNFRDFSPFITNTFLHGGWLHFISNMWILFIFGDNVEDRLGHFKYLIFYLLCGFLASSVHYSLHANSAVPAIGASGAISGVMAAYMFLFPKSRIITFIPIFIILPLLIPIPAFIFIGIWFIGQLYGGMINLISWGTTNIAFWAHIGGFIAGALLYKSFLAKRKKRYTYDY